MRRILLLAAGTILFTGAALPLGASPKLDGEARLARAIEGRIPGEPVDCVNLRKIRSTEIIDDTAILYKTGGGTIYVNRPRAGAESLDYWDVLVTRLYGSRLCSIDVVDLYDSGSRFQTGSVFLGEFVPYERVRGRD